jgi:teichuronic acid biosynthesis glycosyltransferase TuaC
MTSLGRLDSAAIGRQGRNVRVLHVIPGEPQTSEMPYARRESRDLGRVGIDTGVFFLRSRISPITLWNEAIRFRRMIREFRPDLIHAHFGTMTAFFSTYLTSKAAVVTFRGTDLNPDPSQTRLRSLLGRTLSRLAAARAAGIVCVTRELRERLWWNRARAVVLPGSVDLDLFRPRPRAEARIDLGWDDEERVVLFNLGRFPSVKRPDLAAEAVKAAAEQVGPVLLHMLDGSIDPGKIPTLLNAADCLLITSVCEGSPTILREALACNLPVVSVDVGDVRERLKGVSESYVVGRDVRELGSALAAILCRRCRSNGRDAVQDLAVACFNDQLAAIYRAALKQHSKGAATLLQAEHNKARA